MTAKEARSSMLNAKARLDEQNRLRDIENKKRNDEWRRWHAQEYLPKQFKELLKSIENTINKGKSYHIHTLESGEDECTYLTNRLLKLGYLVSTKVDEYSCCWNRGCVRTMTITW